MRAIDADAHVIETIQTWSYLERDERDYTPQLMTQSFGADLLSNEGTAVGTRGNCIDGHSVRRHSHQ
jgi:hypothetical protein